MGIWNNITKMGRKMYSAARNTVSDVYKPIKKITNTIHKGSNFIDGLLDKAVNFGVPHSLVGLLRDNPIYSGIHNAIEDVNGYVNQAGSLGSVVNDFVEHNVFEPIVPKNFQELKGRFEEGKRVAQQVGDFAREGQENLFGARDAIRGFRNRAAVGFSPNQNTSPRDNINF